jgi:DNA-binding MarR family transcriptional regulator
MNRRHSDKLLAQIRQENIGRLLMLSFRRFEEIVVARMRYHGFTDIRMVHTSLIRNIDLAGSRLTDIAARAGLHKQAMSQLASEFEHLGYIRRTADPTDARALLVQFTSKGRALLDVLPAIFEETHSELASIVGNERMRDLAEILTPIAAQQRLIEAQTLKANGTAAEIGGQTQQQLAPTGRKRGRKPRSAEQTKRTLPMRKQAKP